MCVRPEQGMKKKSTANLVPVCPPSFVTLGNPGCLCLASGSLGSFPAAFYGFNNLLSLPRDQLKLKLYPLLKEASSSLSPCSVTGSG